MPFTKRYGPILGHFADFSRGEYGSIGGRRAQVGQFHGLNVVVYLNGSVGPRAGLADAEPDFGVGIPAEPTAIIAIGRERGGAANLWAVDEDGQVWAVVYPGGAGNPWGHYNATIALSDGGNSLIDTVDDGRYTYLTSFGEETYVLSHAAATVTALPASPGGSCIVIFGDRLVVGGVSGSQNQIRFSDANDYTSWPALNFLGIGGTDSVIDSLEVQRNVLIVTMSDGEMFTVSGTLGVNEVVRQFTSNAPRNAVLDAQSIAITKRGVLWRRGRNSVPESFDGSNLRALTNLDEWTVADRTIQDVSVVQGADDDDIFYFGGYGALLELHNGAWTQHALGIRNAPDFVQAFEKMHATYDGSSHAFLVGNFIDATHRLYSLAIALEHPACVALGDTVVDAGTGLAPVAGFTTPEVRDSAGRGLWPRSVLVRFTKYDTGNTESNHFDVTLNRFDAYETTSPPPLLHGTPFNEDPSVATTGGVRQEMIFPFDAGTDVDACSVTISNLRGVAIDELFVFGQIEGQRSAV